jgi:probable phosphoglycerate mutase
LTEGIDPTKNRAASDGYRPMWRAMLLDEPRTTLTVVRHAQQVPPDPTAPQAKRYDRPLSDIGRHQAELVADRLRGERFDAVYCSELSRARDTATAICERGGRGLPIILAQLNEVDVFGQIPADATVTEILERAALEHVLGAFLRTRQWDALPFTESSRSLRARSFGAFQSIADAHEGGHVCVVAHGGVINAFLAMALSIGIDMFFQPAHTSIARVYTWQRAWVLHATNDVGHLIRDDANYVTY